jgi:protein-S-isoprenylcysteine O-methyltransferase Ste14
MLVGILQSIVILLGILAFYLVDVQLMRRYDPLRVEGSSRAWDYTIVAIIAAILLVVQPVLLPILGVRLPFPWGLLCQGIGILLMAAGLYLHWWARVHLQQYYGEREEVQEGQHLIESGPYAYVRHPIYTSYFLFTVGLLLFNPALPTLLALIYALVDFSLATRREERLLQRDLPGYAGYMARTPRFFPSLRNVLGERS